MWHLKHRGVILDWRWWAKWKKIHKCLAYWVIAFRFGKIQTWNIDIFLIPGTKKAVFTFIVNKDWSDSRVPWLNIVLLYWMELNWSECLGQSGIWTSLNGGLWGGATSSPWKKIEEKNPRLCLEFDYKFPQFPITDAFSCKYSSRQNLNILNDRKIFSVLLLEDFISVTILGRRIARVERPCKTCKLKNNPSGNSCHP